MKASPIIDPGVVWTDGEVPKTCRLLTAKEMGEQDLQRWRAERLRPPPPAPPAKSFADRFRRSA